MCTLQRRIFPNEYDYSKACGNLLIISSHHYRIRISSIVGGSNADFNKNRKFFFLVSSSIFNSIDSRSMELISHSQTGISFGSAMDQTILNVSQSSSHRCPINLTALGLSLSLFVTLRQIYHLDPWPLVWFMNFSIKRNKNYGWLVLTRISGVDIDWLFFFQFSCFGICLCLYHLFHVNLSTLWWWFQ